MREWPYLVAGFVGSLALGCCIGLNTAKHVLSGRIIPYRCQRNALMTIPGLSLSEVREFND